MKTMLRLLLIASAMLLLGSCEKEESLTGTLEIYKGGSSVRIVPADATTPGSSLFEVKEGYSKTKMVIGNYCAIKGSGLVSAYFQILPERTTTITFGAGDPVVTYP